ncbi:MAG: methionyl-tRNA formyltransferase [Verrucomicrobiota bacterium]
MPERPKVIYLGSDAICLPGLETLVERCASQCELVGIVSQPDRRQGRGKKLQANPVATFARERVIPLLQPEKPDADLVEWIRSEGVALAFVMAYGHFLPKALREAPIHGIVNFHGSLLPAYRGASPVETAIAEGETETGVCLMRIVKEMDAGGVADCEKLAIGPDETSPEVRARLGEAVRPLIARNLKPLLSGESVFVEQVRSEATFCRRITKEDGAIDFSLAGGVICNRFRAFNPWPGAFFEHGLQPIRVGEMTCISSDRDSRQAPGTVVSAGHSLEVAVGDGLLSLGQLQRPGGRMLPAQEFLRGYPIGVGELLGGRKAVPLVRKEP